MDMRERSTEVSMQELAALVDTAGGEVTATVLQNKATPDPRTFLGEGKVAELKECIEANECDLAVFDNELSPSQMRVLSEELGVRVLDLCTGTGCIALSMAGERPGTHVVATDLSPQAVSLAQRNRDILGLAEAVDVYECDLAEGVPPELVGTFSVLVTNPPYIPTAVLHEQVPPEVRDHEPHLALDGGADGLDVFRRILVQAPRLLAPEGWLCAELSEDNVHAAAELCQAQGCWTGIEVRCDLTRRPRVLVAKRGA
jgi:release factor glutamine methyltransferase